MRTTLPNRTFPVFPVQIFGIEPSEAQATTKQLTQARMLVWKKVQEIGRVCGQACDVEAEGEPRAKPKCRESGRPNLTSKQDWTETFPTIRHKNRLSWSSTHSQDSRIDTRRKVERRSPAVSPPPIYSEH